MYFHNWGGTQLPIVLRAVDGGARPAPPWRSSSCSAVSPMPASAAAAKVPPRAAVHRMAVRVRHRRPPRGHPLDPHRNRQHHRTARRDLRTAARRLRRATRARGHSDDTRGVRIRTSTRCDARCAVASSGCPLAHSAGHRRTSTRRSPRSLPAGCEFADAGAGPGNPPHRESMSATGSSRRRTVRPVPETKLCSNVRHCSHRRLVLNR